MTDRDPMRVRALTRALSELGVVEKRGPLHNARILEYFAATSLGSRPAGHRDETPWCSAFVCWVASEIGAGHPASAWARSWLDAGVAVDLPIPGDVVVFSRGKGGHVGFWLAERDGWVHVLGGNQSGLSWTSSGSVCVKRYPVTRVLGMRKLIQAASA
jgi:uncharacterized protein (TIGR02594 family)